MLYTFAVTVRNRGAGTASTAQLQLVASRVPQAGGFGVQPARGVAALDSFRAACDACVPPPHLPAFPTSPKAGGALPAPRAPNSPPPLPVLNGHVSSFSPS